MLAFSCLSPTKLVFHMFLIISVCHTNNYLNVRQIYMYYDIELHTINDVVDLIFSTLFLKRQKRLIKNIILFFFLYRSFISLYGLLIYTWL